MSSLQYSNVQPDNNKASFNPLDSVIFTVNNQGRSLVLGSVKLEGKLTVNSTGTTRAVTPMDIRFNQNAGVANFIESCQISTANQSQLENISFDYARWVNMVAVATKDRNDSCSSKDVCELKAPINDFTREFTYGTVSPNSGAKETRDMDFSHKLKVCLNRAVSGDVMPFSKSGFTKITIGLAKNSDAFFGTFRTDANVNIDSVNYTLSDLSISYQTVADDGKASPVQMRTIIPIKSTLQSDFANVSSSVPGSCDAVSISYQQLSRSSNTAFDNSALNQLPSWNSIQFTFNGSNSEYVSYIIQNRSDAIKHAISSLAVSGHSQVGANALNTNSTLIHGLNFGEFVPLQSQQFNVQISTDGISTVGTYLIYLYFHSMAQL